MMYIIIAILVATLQLTAVTSDCPEYAIDLRTLGSATPAHEPTPWHVLIYNKKPDSWVPLCGGTLVSPSHVVTAANCLWYHDNRSVINLDNLKVAVGKHCENNENQEQNVQLIKVKAVTLHPGFNASSPGLPRDVAVLELKTAAILSTAISPALIEREHSAGGEHLPAGSSGTMANWNGSEYRTLTSVQLPYQNLSTCAALVHARHGFVPSTDKFCAGVKDDMRTMCRQDFGAGFIYRHPSSNVTFLRGVLSTDLMPTQFTENCHEIDVAGFTNIADPLTLNWLTQVIPGPAVPCPAVLTSDSVLFVYCHKQGVDQDCTQPMPTGFTSVSRCNIGYHIDSNQNSKTSTCQSDGVWTDSHLTCVQVHPCYPSPCGPSSQCVESNGRADCACLPTFRGSPPSCRPECDVSEDCGPTRYCENNTCHEVCPGACAEQASCTVVDRRPLCSCEPGYTGDASSSCTLIPVNPCDPSPCGPGSQCVESNGRADCACLPTYLGSPPSCRPECEVSEDCGPTRYCENNTCHDVCLGACAVQASCTVVDRRPLCSCEPGYTGDASSSCTLIPDPCDPSPCGPSSQCVESNGRADCACLPTYLGSPPSCRPECDVSADCGPTRYCENNTCHEVCAGACAEQANCTVVDRSPLCSCQPGYTGDARASCTLIPVHPGYESIPGLANVYKFHVTAQRWLDAKATCEREGSHLVILNSEAEYQAMLQLRRVNDKKIVGAYLTTLAWVGLRESTTRQGEFFTVLGQPLYSTGFTRWRSRFPIYKTFGDVVYISTTYDGLQDTPGNRGSPYRQAFICELEVR